MEKRRKEPLQGFNPFEAVKLRQVLGKCLWIVAMLLVILSRDFQFCHCRLFPTSNYPQSYPEYTDQLALLSNRTERFDNGTEAMSGRFASSEMNSRQNPMDVEQAQVLYNNGNMNVHLLRGMATTTSRPARQEMFGSQEGSQRFREESVEQVNQNQGHLYQSQYDGSQDMSYPNQGQVYQNEDQNFNQAWSWNLKEDAKPEKIQVMATTNPEVVKMDHHYVVNSMDDPSFTWPLPQVNHQYGGVHEFRQDPYVYPPVYRHKPPRRRGLRRPSWLAKKRRHIYDRFMTHLHQRRQADEGILVPTGPTAAGESNNSGETGLLEWMMMPAAFVALSMLTMDILGRIFPFSNGNGWKPQATTTIPPKITKINISPPQIPIVSDIIELKKAFFDKIKEKKADKHEKYKKFKEKFHNKFKKGDKKGDSYGWSSEEYYWDDNQSSRSKSKRRSKAREKGQSQEEPKHPRYSWQRLQQLYQQQIREQQEVLNRFQG